MAAKAKKKKKQVKSSVNNKEKIEVKNKSTISKTKKDIKTSRWDDKNKKKVFSKELIGIIIFVIYAIIFLYVSCHHELWRDEAQSWEIAKNLNIFEIFGQLKYEGHPFLWYYFLRIFAILKMKYIYIGFISAILNLITTFIFLKKSRFNNFVNAIVIFSSGFFLFAGIVCRSYSLAYLLMILLMFMYKDRYDKPVYYGVLIFLIMNTHILLLGFIGSLMLIDLYEFVKVKEHRKSIIISASMFLGGLVLLFLQFFNTVGSTGKSPQFSKFAHFWQEMKNIFMAVLGKPWLLGCTFIIMIILLIYLIVKKEYKNLIIYFCSVVFQILFALLIYGSVNATCLIYLCILFVVMQLEDINLFVSGVIVFLFGFTLNVTYGYMDNEVKYVFSDSINVAKFIEEEIPKGSKIYCESIDFCVAISSYIPHGKYHFIDYNTDKEFIFTPYGDYLKVVNNLNVVNDPDFLKKKKLDYYIDKAFNANMFENKVGSDDYELIYSTKVPVLFSGESYVIYKYVG